MIGVPSIASSAPDVQVQSFNGGDGDAVDADRVRSVRRACSEDAGEWNVGVARGMCQEDAAVGEVQPGEHDELVAGLDALKPVGNGGIELEPRLRCAFERLIGSVGWGAER
jgi:hypothetical protein